MAFAAEKLLLGFATMSHGQLAPDILSSSAPHFVEFEVQSRDKAWVTSNGGTKWLRFWRHSEDWSALRGS